MVFGKIESTPEISCGFTQRKTNINHHHENNYFSAHALLPHKMEQNIQG